MADIIASEVTALTPTKIEKAEIAAMKLPRFVDRKNVLVVKDEVTGERGFTVQQELPAYLRRKNVKQYTVHSAERKVGRREMRAVDRLTKSLCNRTRVEEGQTLRLPGAQGEQLFYRVVRKGWFSARYHDVKGHRLLAIDRGPGAAELEADLELYEGFREVTNG